MVLLRPVLEAEDGVVGGQVAEVRSPKGRVRALDVRTVRVLQLPAAASSPTATASAPRVHAGAPSDVAASDSDLRKRLGEEGDPPRALWRQRLFDAPHL